MIADSIQSQPEKNVKVFVFLVRLYSGVFHRLVFCQNKAPVWSKRLKLGVWSDYLIWVSTRVDRCPGRCPTDDLADGQMSKLEVLYVARSACQRDAAQLPRCM